MRTAPKNVPMTGLGTIHDTLTNGSVSLLQTVQSAFCGGSYSHQIRAHVFPRLPLARDVRGRYGCCDLFHDEQPPPPSIAHRADI
jgi:hypothetical protein